MIVSRQICKKCDRKARYENNKDKESAKAKERYKEYSKDPDFIARRKEYDRIRKESGARKEYLKSNPQKSNKRNYDTPEYRVKNRLRQKIQICVRNKDWVPKHCLIIGCDLQTFRNHIESLFKEGMTWENYGPKGWHIDHIKPCCLFDLLDPEEQKKCFHYTNLQPLWWHENIKKSNKYDEGAGGPDEVGVGEGT